MAKVALPGIYWTRIGKNRAFLTKNATPGKTWYGENLIREDGEEYRVWEPEQSKLSAALHNGLKDTRLEEEDNILYLGSSTGTTVSHLSDFARLIFAVDSAPRVMRDFLLLSKGRDNIAPILADAGGNIGNRICQVDWLYQDVAQKNQVEIFKKNARFLRQGGHGILAVKARSIDVTKKPTQIFAQVEKELKTQFQVLEKIDLAPYQKDHMLFVVKNTFK